MFKLPQEIKRPSSSRRTSIIDVNFNPEGAREESGGAAEVEVGKVRKSRKKRRSKKEQVPAVLDYNTIPLDMLVNKCNVNKGNQSQPTSDATPGTLTPDATTPEPLDLDDDIATGDGADGIVRELTFKLQRLASRVSISRISTGEDKLDGGRGDEGQREEGESGGGRERERERLWKTDVDVDRGRTEDEKEKEDIDEEMKCKLYRLVGQSTLTYLTSTDDELDRAGQSEEDVGELQLTCKLRQLEKQAGANQFSSTEDELDRVSFSDGEKEDLAVKLCRLASQVDAAQFSSTEDELDRAGSAIDEDTLWTMEAARAAQVRDLAGLVSASQFSSTEDELDRVGDDEGEREEEVDKGEIVTESAAERSGSIGDLDVSMFDLWDEVDPEGEKSTDTNKVGKDTRRGESCEEETVPDSERKAEAVRQDETEARKAEKKGCAGEGAREDRNEGERSVEEQTGTVDVLREAQGEREKDTDERQEKELDVEVEAKRLKERVEERIAAALQGTRVPQKAENDEEDVEFDRIISSMLMMSVDEMQVDTQAEKVEGGFGEIKRRNKELVDDKIVGETGKIEKTVDAQNTNVSKEAVSAEEIRSGGDDMMPESVVSEGERGYLEIGELSRKNGVAVNVNAQQETETHPPERLAQRTDLEKQRTVDVTMNDTREERDEARWTCKSKAVHEEDREETRGKGRQGDPAVESDGTFKGTNEKSGEDMEQSASSDLEGILSPEEIQNVRTADGKNVLTSLRALILYMKVAFTPIVAVRIFCAT